MLLVEAADGEHVVDVVMREHDRRERRVGAPGAHGRVHARRIEQRAGVEHHEPVACVEDVDAGDALQRQQVGRQLARVLVARVDGVMLVRRVQLAAPGARGELAEVRHGTGYSEFPLRETRCAIEWEGYGVEWAPMSQGAGSRDVPR